MSDASMTQLLEAGLANAIAATGLALVAALAARLHAKPPLVHCLWVIVLVKLITPPVFYVPLPAPVSIATEAPAQSALPRSIGGADARPANGRTELAPPRMAPATIPDASRGHRSADTAGGPFWDWTTTLISIWAMGSCVVFGSAVHRIWRFQQLLRHATIAPPELYAVARLQARRIGLATCPRLRITTGTVSPLTWCPIPLGHPLIVLPQRLLSNLDSAETEAILVHELAHLRRRDHWMRWIELVVTAVFWWHPVAWWASREIRRWGDQCCDAWVLWVFPSRSREYSAALLKTIDFLAERRLPLPPMASAVGQALYLERRMQMILRHQLTKELSWSSRLAVLAVALVALPVSSRFVAQAAPPPAGAERPAPGNTSPDPAEAQPGEAADPREDAAIPREGIIEFTITRNGKQTTTNQIQRALSALRAQAQRPQPDDSFAAVININGTAREFVDPQQAYQACEVVARAIRLARQARIPLGELGRLEGTTQRRAAGRQQTGGADGARAAFGAGPRPRDGDDGFGVGGGLGGAAGGFGAAAATGGRGGAAGGTGGRGGVGGQGGAAGQPGRAGAGGREQYLENLREMLSQVLVAKQPGQQQDVPPAAASWSVPDEEPAAATLFSRMAYRDYEKATFSFEFGLRDDPARRIGNDWDLQYGNGGNHFHVTMVSDDLSRMIDLGEITWQQFSPSQIPQLAAYPQPRREMIPAVQGHMYLVHTKDRNSDLYALFRVEQITQQGTCDITWHRISTPGKEQGQD